MRMIVQGEISSHSRGLVLPHLSITLILVFMQYLYVRADRENALLAKKQKELEAKRVRLWSESRKKKLEAIHNRKREEALQLGADFSLN